MKRNSVALAAVLILFVCSYSYSQVIDGYQNGLKYINKEDIRKTITYLASDELKGRATGTPENLEAARFVANKFNEFGLVPYDELANTLPFKKKKTASTKTDFKPENFFQRFNLFETKINPAQSKLELVKKGESSKKVYGYECNKDFVVDYSSNRNILLKGQIVFLGYGIEKDGNGYNDYLTEDGKTIDVKNKIAVVVEGFPQEADTSSYFSKSKSKEIKSIKQKAELLNEKGALALLVVQSPIKNLPHFTVKLEAMAKAFSRSEFGLPELKPNESLPIIYISRDVLNDIMHNTGKNITEILKTIDKDLKPRSFELPNTSVEISVSYEKKLIETQNVIGFLEGSDPELKNEYIVVGGHYDHVGVGNYGAMNKTDIGKIHNGADDNASGTAGVIEVAEAFSKVRPKRSIIFIGFSAEENGIHGSRHYAYQNPLMPLDKTIGMINLDMIGRNDKKLVWAGGIFYSNDLKKLAEDANTVTGFELLYNVGLLTFGSDQAPFIRKNIPSLFFFTGMHDEYHTPADDADKIDFEKVENVSKLAFVSGWIMANQKSKPIYKPLTMEEKTELVKESIGRQKKYKVAEIKSE